MNFCHGCQVPRISYAKCHCATVLEFARKAGDAGKGLSPSARIFETGRPGGRGAPRERSPALCRGKHHQKELSLSAKRRVQPEVETHGRTSGRQLQQFL